MIHFSYSLDAAGNLIRLELGMFPDALIPGAASIASAADELAHPFPWTKTVEDAINEIRFVPQPHLVGTPAQAISETRRLPQSPFVFVPPSPDYADDSQIMEMILLYDELPIAASDGREQIASALCVVGVQQIPFISRYVPELHSSRWSHDITQYAQPGWISNTKVYRKAALV
ncbi:MAG: hypothetical protein B7X51_00755 [Pseudomonas sp. 34-62-33]|nr:MAG: hypothetical protein B7X51_00755 [Pseudomonas sp. 34-62-33]